MNILVTGGAGFIGSHLVDLLVARGHAVVVMDNLDPQVHGPGASEPRHLQGHVQAGAVHFLRADVTDVAACRRALAGVEAVAHLAAAVGVGQSMYAPDHYVRNNSAGTGALLQAIVEAREAIGKLVVASSMSLYGEGAYGCPACGGREAAARTEDRLRRGAWETPCAACGADLEPVPTPEAKPAEIASVYAATKKNQEDLFVAFGAAYRIPTFALRFFNVFGARQSLSNPYTGVAAIFLSRLLNGHAPLVFEDGLQSRDFIEVRDVARAVLLALESPADGCHVLNVGTGRRTTVRQVAEAIGAALGLDIPPQLLGRFRAGDIRHCLADPARARQVLGFEPAFTFASGLPALIEWCQSEAAVDRVDGSLAELEQRGLVR